MYIYTYPPDGSTSTQALNVFTFFRRQQVPSALSPSLSATGYSSEPHIKNVFHAQNHTNVCLVHSVFPSTKKLKCKPLAEKLL